MESLDFKKIFSFQSSTPKLQKSFTLLEVIVAIFLITVGIATSLLLITRTIGQMSISESQLIAAYLTQEGIEIVRNIRDTNWLEQSTDPTNLWDEGLTGCGGTCDGITSNGCIADYTYSTQPDPNLPFYTGQSLFIDTNGFYNHTGVTQTKFRRKIVITPAADILTVCVRVEWQEKGKTYSHSAQENLYNWK